MKKIVEKNGIIVIEKDGGIISPAAYMTYVTANAEYKDFIDAGYKLFSICLSVGGCPANEEAGFIKGFEEGIWKTPNEFDFSSLDKNLSKLLGDGKKELQVILRINLNMPYWWRERYKEELTLFNNGETLMQSVFSERWKEDAKLFLTKLKEHTDGSVYKDNILGWQIAAMHTEEWIAPWLPDICDDFSQPSLLCFRKYCKTKYVDVNRLNAEWKTVFSDFNEITVPTFEERKQKNETCSDSGILAKVRDYYTFYNKGYSDAIIYFCRYVKYLFKGDMLAGCFYGYIAQLNCSQGHCSFNDLLDCKEIDFFASPFSYAGQRAKAIDWFYHTPMNSVAEAKKIWFIEADVRTYKTRPLYESAPHLLTERTQKEYFDRPVWKGPKNYEDSVNNILRSFSKVFISRNAFWWFDMWGGWYKGKRFMSLLKKMLELYNAEIEKENKSACEIAVILDQNTSYNVPDSLFYQAVFNQFIELGFLGAPYDIYLLDKFDKKIADRYKMLLFTAPRSLTEVHKEIIKDFDKKGKSVLFTGDVDGDFDESSTSCFDRKELKEYAEKCGVHLYSYGNTVYANERYLSVTAATDGTMTVNTPEDCTLVSFMDGKKYKTKNKILNLKVKSNKTFLFEIEK